jgi:MoxR-like ATPase
MNTSSWHLYHGGETTADDAALRAWLDDPPPWRRRATAGATRRGGGAPRRGPPHDEARGRRYVTVGGEAALDRVNMALLLRRPLLVFGPPGLGKSSLAYNIAWCLGLGGPLRWEINSRTGLQDGLYHYDAVRHLHGGTQAAPIGDFVTLGPLGTALLPTARPRVLLIDELDKAGYDLPNDLLHVFEEGEFVIPELVGVEQGAHAWPLDRRPGEAPIALPGGAVRTWHHPVVVITSNQEREFPEAFRRRCVVLELTRPEGEVLAAIVRSWFPGDPGADLEAVIAACEGQNTDVVLQALFLAQAPRAADLGRVGAALRRGS